MKIGERVGDYEIVEILGAGGMGEVYKVRNVLSQRIEAMKVLLGDLASSGTASAASSGSGGGASLADRFQREMRVQAALDHPNIAKLYTATSYNNQLLMIMEFVEGSSLAKILEQGPISVRDAANYTIQVLDALGYAHERGVVHRDIKPANIIRMPSGQVKLLDFGIAKMKTDHSLTQTGHTVGSLYYMSPEQIKGLEPDPRSDLYSLGIMLYEMVTGRRPFQGDSAYSIMAAHLEQAPMAPIEVVPGVPPALSDIIVMAMAKDPASRFQSAQAFAGALRSVIHTGAAAPVPPQHVVTNTLIAPPPIPQAPMPQAVLPPTLPHAIPPTLPHAVPPPVYAAPPPPAVSQQQVPYQQVLQQQYVPPAPMTPKPASSRRGLYMALGSIATLVVLALAVIEGPKLLHTLASNETPQTAAVQPAPAAPAQPAPAANPQFPVEQPPIPQPSAPAQPGPAAPTPAASRPAPVSRPAATPVRQTTPAPSPQFPVEQPVAQQPAQQAPQQQPAVQPHPAQSEMKELREEYNQLAIRVGYCKSALKSIEQQMARQGVGMRGDIREGEIRVDYLMKEAMDSIRNGDAEGAKKNLQMATRALEPIEKFLGR